MDRPSSANTRIGCEPEFWMLTPSICTSGMSCSRYCTIYRPLESSILSTAISSRRVTRPSGTAFGCALPARNTSSDVNCSPELAWWLAFSSAICWDAALEAPSAFAMPLGSMIMMTAPSPRMVLPENISMWRSFVDIGLTTISSV